MLGMAGRERILPLNTELFNCKRFYPAKLLQVTEELWASCRCLFLCCVPGPALPPVCPEPREVWAGLAMLSCAHFVCCPVLSVVVGGCIYRSTVGCWVTCSWKWTNIHVRLVRKLVSCSAICLKQIFTHQVFLFYRLP